MDLGRGRGDPNARTVTCVADAKRVLAWKLVGFAAATTAGTLTRNIGAKTYEASRGEPAPDRPSSPIVPLRHALIWAVSSGIVGELVRLLIERSAANAWVQATGELPPGLEAEPEDEDEDSLNPDIAADEAIHD
jgi:hypothetical protein